MILFLGSPFKKKTLANLWDHDLAQHMWKYILFQVTKLIRTHWKMQGVAIFSL